MSCRQNVFSPLSRILNQRCCLFTCDIGHTQWTVQRDTLVGRKIRRQPVVDFERVDFEFFAARICLTKHPDGGGDVGAAIQQDLPRFAVVVGAAVCRHCCCCIVSRRRVSVLNYKRIALIKNEGELKK